VTAAAFRIAVLPGDGIGVEVVAAGLAALDALAASTPGLAFDWQHLPGGARHYLETGTAFSDESMRALETCDAILFGAMGLPDVRLANGTEIAPQLDIREHFELYAGVRPIRVMPNTPAVLANPRAKDIDLVILREQTEGFFHSRGKADIEHDGANDHSRITRKGAERLFDFAFRLARRRKAAGHPGIVTCVDKSNVLTSMAYMRGIFDERAKLNPDLEADHCYVDAMALNLVRQPWVYDVIVTENLFGDILSDLGGGLAGGMGLAPSGDIGDRHAMFQPAHGSAPDIAGKGIANPTAMLLSCAMMLEWLGEQHGDASASAAGHRLDAAVLRVYGEGRVRPFEFGGKDGTTAITRAVLKSIEEEPISIEGQEPMPAAAPVR
jgi:3-isopropylmalate dehydrogenase